MELFFLKVLEWMLICFGPAIAADKDERNARFLEESLELVQSCGMSEEDCHKLVAYTYSRPLGEKSQEVGGVMVTLAALCGAQEIDLHDAAFEELNRIFQPEVMERIRKKQLTKPHCGPLPGVYPERSE